MMDLRETICHTRYVTPVTQTVGLGHLVEKCSFGMFYIKMRQTVD